MMTQIWNPATPLPVYGTKPDSPELRMVREILKGSVEDLRNTCGCRVRCRHRFDADEAKAWFMDDDDDPSCFSFVRVCGILGLEVDAVRQSLGLLPKLKRV